ncbi:toxin-antitoxin system YwqK family antitoxin [Planctomicrobium piriforme]|uniref:MORN repeat variant n=1 Tax=Planctomicrobium piriforme TaxID=1576369 RepID=A0A1I3D1I4_9PLAN|nr:hypothetical protein [Planctomicrobium piriforme]SFH80572.1 hypothetical protein SAMN05421753_10353 [Planctomicrobium piriforme]
MRIRTRFPILTTLVVSGCVLYSSAGSGCLPQAGFFSPTQRVDLPDGAWEIRSVLPGGIQHGTTTTYHPDGNRIYEIEYRWGQHIEATQFLPNGNRALHIHQDETGVTRYDFYDEQGLFIRRE